MTSLRVEWLKKNYGKALSAALRERERFTADDGEWLVDHIRSFDPTRNGRFTHWAITTYLKDGFRLEDMEKLRETLLLFVSVQKRLDVSRRDIGQYETLADLWFAVKSFADVNQDETFSGKALKRIGRDEAYQQSIIIELENGSRLALPLTETAAKWWGRGTRWCTAADKDNAFQTYFKTGPLVVVDTDAGVKFQLWAEYGGSGVRSIQFMTEDDAPLRISDWLDHWDAIRSAVLWVMQFNSAVLKMVPDELLDASLCEAAVAVIGDSYQHVPDKLKSERVKDLAVANDGRVLSQLPIEDRNRDRCHAAVSNNGVAIDHVPQEYMTVELQALACKTHGTAIGRIPAELRSREICLDAVRSNGYALQYVPEHHLDEEIYEAAVKCTPYVLENVPLLYRTEVVCLGAMGAGVVPSYLIPSSIYLKQGFLSEAVTLNPRLLGHVPDFAITYDVMVSAVSKDSCYLGHVPTDLRESVLAHPDVQARLAYDAVPVWLQKRDAADELKAIIHSYSYARLPGLCA